MDVPIASEQEQFDAAYDEANRQEESDQAQIAAITASLGQSLLSEFHRRKSERSEVEKRWLAGLRQYNGQYEPDFADFLKERKAACKVFVPLTRRICNIVEARLGDLLFGTDDRNFAVETSPHPELDEAAELMKTASPDAPIVIDGVEVNPTEMSVAIAEQIEESKRKAASMQRVIDDQFSESDYPTEARKVIHDAVKLGSGVIKGPFVLRSVRKKWSLKGGAPELVEVEQFKPVIRRVDPWNFYPSLSVGSLVEDSSTFERHPINKLGLVKLADQPDFDSEAIVRVLKAGGSQYRDGNVDAQREAAGTVGVEDSRFNVIEYNGPVDAEDLISAGVELPEDNDLLVFNAIVWFSEFTGEVIKAAINPMSTDNAMYSVFNWQPDAACVFGYGLPYEISDMQWSANSTYRGAHDNMALTVGPQIIFNSKKVRPVNGSPHIEPMKTWDMTDSSVPVSNVFGVFQIESRLPELINLFNLNKQLAEEIGGPMLAMQGQDAPSYLDTAKGMSIAYNAANIWMRRAVKLWDDQVTVPRVRAFVDWNMEHNPDPDIKGDLNVVPRGTSALLEAEGQVQRLQLLTAASREAGVPIRKMINQLRQMALAMRFDPDELLPSDDEITEIEKNQTPPPNPEMERIRIREMELTDKSEERSFRERIIDKNNSIRLAEIASRENLTVEQVRSKYGLEIEKMDRQERMDQARGERETAMFNAELATKAAHGSGI